MSRRRKSFRPYPNFRHGRRSGVRGHELDRFEGGLKVTKRLPSGELETYFVDQHGRRIEPGEQQEQPHGDESV